MWPPPCYFRTRIATVRDRRRRKSQVDDEQEVKFKSMTRSKHFLTPREDTNMLRMCWNGSIHWNRICFNILKAICEQFLDQCHLDSIALSIFVVNFDFDKYWIWDEQFLSISLTFVAEDSFKGQSSAITDWPLKYFQIGWNCILYFYTWSVERHLPLFWHGEEWAQRSIVLVLTPCKEIDHIFFCLFSSNIFACFNIGFFVSVQSD